MIVPIMFLLIGLKSFSYLILLISLNTIWIIMVKGKITSFLWGIQLKMILVYKKWVLIMSYSLFNWFRLELKSSHIDFFKALFLKINPILPLLSHKWKKMVSSLHRNFLSIQNNKSFKLRSQNFNKTSIIYRINLLTLIQSSQTQSFTNI